MNSSHMLSLFFIFSILFASSVQQQVSGTNSGGGSGNVPVSGGSVTSAGPVTGGNTGGGSIPIAQCTPFFCPAIVNDDSPAINPKFAAPRQFMVGVLQSAITNNPNSLALAKFAAYTLNSNPDILPNISVRVYSVLSLASLANMEASTIALFSISGVKALLVDTDEEGTQAIAQLGGAFQAPVISLSSITQALANKANFPSFLRISPSARYGTTAMLQVLADLGKNTSIYIYTQDTFGNSAANDFLNQAEQRNVSVYAVGLPTAGSIDDALRSISRAVNVNWNVFVIAANVGQLGRVYAYLNQSKYVGKDFLQLISPLAERQFANGTVQSALMDGAIGFLPSQIKNDTASFETFVPSWAAAPEANFPGDRPYPLTGYLAHDALMALALAYDAVVQNSSFPDLSAQSFVDLVKRMEFEGLSGDVSFDQSGDRVGDYTILNHRGNEPKPIGRFTFRTGEVTLNENYTFWRGSKEIPMLVNITVNMTLFCSYTPPDTTPTTTTGGISGGTTPPPEGGSSSSEDNSSIIIDPGHTGPEPIITGHIDPTNTSRCICDPGYGGDHCDKIVKIKVYKKSLPSISIALGVVTALCFLIAIFAAVMLGLFWENFRKHGSFYCAVIITGVFFAYASSSVLLPEPTTELCMLFPWFLGIGFTLVYGCLFIKTWTLYEVYRSAEQLKKTNLTPMSIIKGIGAYLAVEVLILIIWTAVDRPTVTYRHMVDDTYILSCTTHPTFWAIFAGIKSVWLVFGAILSVLTRGIAKEYSESKSIAYATYNIMALLAIGIPLALALRNIPGGLMIIEVCVILIAFTFTMVSLFFGVWLRIFGNDKIDMPTLPYNSNKRASSQTKSGSKSSGSRESPRSRSEKDSSEMVIRI